MKRQSYVDALESIWDKLSPPKNFTAFQKETWLMKEIDIARLKASFCWKEQDKSLIAPETIENYDLFCISTLFEIYAVLTEDSGVFLICCNKSPEFCGILDIIKASECFECTVFIFEGKRYILDDVKAKRL